MDILLPFVSEPSGAAIAVIDKCMAMAGDLGARVTATAVEEEILVRPFRPVRSRWLGRVLERVCWAGHFSDSQGEIQR
jgi:hypothetical protein